MQPSDQITVGDCRRDLSEHGPFDLIIADPPYGVTSLEWDRNCDGWIQAAAAMLKPVGSMWVFGSMRFLMATGNQFSDYGWKYAQDIVWEKHNGSGLHSDRFRRVHEHVVQFYRGEWQGVYNDVQTVNDAIARVVRGKRRPQHWGGISDKVYQSVDGGPRLMRSVVYMRSDHGRAIHPTQKPASLIEILVRTSCPQYGSVGDLFAGSGSAWEACLRSGRRYAGTEIDPVMAAAAEERVRSVLAL